MKKKVSLMGRVAIALVLALSLMLVTAVPVAAADAVVDIAAIPGVTAPVTGGAPVAAIEATAQYTGAVTWSPDPGATFAADTTYTAIIILTPAAGFTLTGVAANSFTVAGATATNPADSGVVTAVFPATDAVVDIAAIPGVTVPALGESPVAVITPTDQYTGTVVWSPDEDPFLGEQVYTATITLTAKTGFTLTGVAADFFTVAGTTTDTNPVDSGVVTAVFPETAAAVVDIAAIPGVTVPVIGEHPVAAITATDQYTGSVTWAPIEDPFTGQAHTATITLAVKTGFTFTDVTADFFTVAGATATNDANLGVVTAVFPAAEAAAVVDIEAIPGVTVPVVGEVPVALITDTAEYTGTVTWSPDEDPFLGEQVYEATITLVAKTGFTLTGVTADFFTVAGVTTVSNPVDSGVVTAIFPATAAAVVVDIAIIPGVTAPVTGGTPVTAIAPTAQYTGAVTWSPADGTFAGDTVYTATITLAAEAGFTFTGVAADFFTVAGTTTDTNPVDSGVVTAVFPATDAVIDIAAIPGVTPPAVGGTPAATITATDQYTGAVAWTPPDSPFEAEQAYTAIIILTPKAGFTLEGVAADSFTVAGATATNPADSGVVTAVFPVTYDVLIGLNVNDWTLVSTDKYILSSGDNTSAFIGSVSLIYKYDGTYLSATVADLKPVEAIYVKTTGTDGQLGLKYSGGVPVASDKDLVAGWNLISSATTDFAGAVLSPLQYVQAGEQQGVGLATLVSQETYNLTTVAWYIDATTWSSLAALTMIPFDGYWVYMNAAESFGVLSD